MLKFVGQAETPVIHAIPDGATHKQEGTQNLELLSEEQGVHTLH